LLDVRLVLIGDDLNFAQKFTRTAADGLSLLAEMDNPRAQTESAVVIDMMVTLQRGAKRLRARHIYSGAQNVLSALHHEDITTLSGRIENLGCVVTEYARGLEDLLQAPATNPIQAPKDKWESARDALDELLPKAAPETADMLSRLMRAPVTLGALQPESVLTERKADILSFDRTEKPKSSKLALADKLTEAYSPEAKIKPRLNPDRPSPHTEATPKAALVTDGVQQDKLIVTLDAMMRDVVADALSVARNVGRTISLSYDMGDRTLTEAGAETLRRRLGEALSQIIRQSLAKDRIGHIDINLAGEQLHIVTGTTAVRVAIDPSRAPAAAKPLITKETEQGLRTQLNALLDPVSIHETAS
jgi:hypothetical protein